MENKNINCAIVVSSCDRYRDVWAPFFTLFFRYWPDCPYPVYLISNELKYSDERIKAITISPDQGWSSNLLAALARIPEKYIIYLQEDYFLRAKVDNNKISQALDLIEEAGAAYLRLFPCPGPDLAYQNRSDVGAISQNAAYRNTTQAAIWNKATLAALLRPGETGWDFEVNGGLERARHITAPFLAYREPVLNYFCTAVVKGKYLYDAVHFARREGIKLDTRSRKSENLCQYLFRKSRIKPWLRKLIKGS